MKPISSLPPFKRLCVTIGNLPSSYVDSMSYYECLMWLCKYLQETVVPAINENAEAVNELINWFNNLNVQDEIDNKLDEMAESGQLQEIVAEYLNSQALFVFDTVAEMLEATNLIDGSNAKTLGYYTKNDGGGSTYKIVDDDTLVVDNLFVLSLTSGLKAQIIVENELNIKQFGAKADGQTDITSILNALLQTDYNNIFIPDGNYAIKDTVVIDKNSKSLYGKSYTSSALLIFNNGKIKCGVFANSTNYLQFRNLTFRINGDRTISGSNNGYAFDIENCNITLIENCCIRSDNGINDLNGVCFRLTNNQNAHCYDNKILNNRFQKAALTLIHSTDNFIDNNMFWGEDLVDTASLNLHGNCSNSTITNNHITPTVVSGLKIFDSCNQLRITNNYFDAGNKVGLIANTLTQAIITDNIFFNPSLSISIDDLSMSTISNNTFRNGDHANEGYPDIRINTRQGGNTFVSNTHLRTGDVTHTNINVPYDLPADYDGYPHSVVNMAMLRLTSYFQATDTTQYARTHFVNCYPASLFTE